jgi:hypothetical protein
MRLHSAYTFTLRHLPEHSDILTLTQKNDKSREFGGNISVQTLTCSQYDISSTGNFLHPFHEPDLASVCLIFPPGEQALSLGRAVALFKASTDDALSHAVGRDFEYHVVHV